MDLPAKHVDNTLQSAEFWANKVLLADRSAPSQEWVKALKELLKGLAAYVKQHHAAGPAWNPTGVLLSQYTPGAEASGEALCVSPWSCVLACLCCTFWMSLLGYIAVTESTAVHLHETAYISAVTRIVLPH